MSTKAHGLKAVTKPTIIQKATDSAVAIIAKTDAPQALKDKATALQTLIGKYGSALDDFNSDVVGSTTKATALNTDLTDVKTSYAELKTLAKGMVNMGLAKSTDLAAIGF